MHTTLPSSQCHPSAHCLGVNNSSAHSHQATFQLIWASCPFHLPVCAQSYINHPLGLYCPLPVVHLSSGCQQLIHLQSSSCPSSHLAFICPLQAFPPLPIHCP